MPMSRLTLPMVVVLFLLSPAFAKAHYQPLGDAKASKIRPVSDILRPSESVGNQAVQKDASQIAPSKTATTFVEQSSRRQIPAKGGGAVKEEDAWKLLEEISSSAPAENRDDSPNKANIAAYRQFLIQADNALSKGDSRFAKAILELCPKEQRHFEWTHLFQRTQNRDSPALIEVGQPVWSIQANAQLVFVGAKTGATSFSPTEIGVARRVLNGHERTVRAITLQQQGHLLATAGVDRLVKIWDSRNSTELHSLSGHKALVRALAFSPDGKHLASASDDKTIKIWDAIAGQEVRTLEGHKGMVTGLGYLPRGDFLVSSGGDGTIKMWNVATGEVIKSWTAHADVVSHIAFAPDGKRLASAGGTDGRIKMWDLSTGKLLQCHEFADQHRAGIGLLT